MLPVMKSLNRCAQDFCKLFTRRLSLHQHTPYNPLPLLLNAQCKMNWESNKPTMLYNVLEKMQKNQLNEPMHMDSVMRKRRTKMKKHKLRKRRKEQKAERRKKSQGK